MADDVSARQLQAQPGHERPRCRELWRRGMPARPVPGQADSETGSVEAGNIIADRLEVATVVDLAILSDPEVVSDPGPTQDVDMILSNLHSRGVDVDAGVVDDEPAHIREGAPRVGLGADEPAAQGHPRRLRQKGGRTLRNTPSVWLPASARISPASVTAIVSLVAER